MIDLNLKSELENALSNIREIEKKIDRELKQPIVLPEKINEDKTGDQEVSTLSKGSKVGKNQGVLIKVGVAAIGVSLLAIGLATKRTGLTIGGAVSLGVDLIYAISMAGSKSSTKEVIPTTKISHGNNYDFTLLIDRIYRSTTKKVKEMSSLWNTVVEQNHSKLRNAVMSSSMPELEKSKFLAIVAEEIPFNPSLTNLLSQLEKLGRAKDLEGIKNIIKEFMTSLQREFKTTVLKQEEVYKSIEFK